MNFNTFKNEVSNYVSYRRSLKHLEEERDDILYQYGGAKGIAYDRISGSGDPHSRERMLLEMSEKLEEIERAIDHTQIKIDDIERYMSKLPDDIREMATMLYVEKHTLRYVGMVNGYSYNGIYQKVKREVEKI